jgi:hypothetical protein
MKHSGVSTVYANNGRTYQSYILAGTIEEADALRFERNIGERITSGITTVSTLPDYHDHPDIDFLAALDEVMEQAAFLSYLAFASGKIPLEEALGRSSAMQRLAALARKQDAKAAAELIARARNELHRLQRLAPGVFPDSSGYYITVTVAPNKNKTIQQIVPRSEVSNLGPATIVICDCDTDPDCTISDLDEPCGYHQTIEAAMKRTLDTEKDLVHIHNNSAKEMAKVKIKVSGGRK